MRRGGRSIEGEIEDGGAIAGKEPRGPFLDSGKEWQGRPRKARLEMKRKQEACSVH
jgi:hypothetical protein